MELAEGLRRGFEVFDVDVPYGTDLTEWLSAGLSATPSATARLSGIAASLLPGIAANHARISASFAPTRIDVPVFAAKDTFELACAASLAARKHLELVKIVVDNSSGFTDPHGLISKMRDVRGMVGEDLLSSQSSGSLAKTVSLCGGRIISYTWEPSYFESAETFGSLVCVIGEHAAAAQSKAGWDGRVLANELMRWMRENISYLDTGELADHSAAALIRTGHAVCQGIAAYANQFLWSCGIPSRYVSGFLDGGRHAWNVAKIDGRWTHLDYTLGLSDRTISDIAGVPMRRFTRRRTWDAQEYSVKRNDYVTGIRKALGESTLAMVPEGDSYRVNGCLVDTGCSHPVCIVRGGIVLVSAGDLAKDLGGGAARRGDFLRFVHGCRLVDVPMDEVVCVGRQDYIPVRILPDIGFRVSLDGDVISIRPIR